MHCIVCVRSIPGELISGASARSRSETSSGRTCPQILYLLSAQLSSCKVSWMASNFQCAEAYRPCNSLHFFQFCHHPWWYLPTTSTFISWTATLLLHTALCLTVLLATPQLGLASSLHQVRLHHPAVFTVCTSGLHPLQLPGSWANIRKKKTVKVNWREQQQGDISDIVCGRVQGTQKGRDGGEMCVWEMLQQL